VGDAGLLAEQLGHDRSRRAADRKCSGVVAVGPELTNRRLAPEYLQRFLADPSITGNTNRMPNLDLKQAEIGALIAFLNKTEGQTGAGN